MTMSRARQAVKAYIFEQEENKGLVKQSKRVVFCRTTISPEIASQMLKCQPKKRRRLNYILLLTMKEAITKGEDDCFTHPIVFNNWILMDGIHRLQACVDTNIPFKSDIRFFYEKDYKRFFKFDRDPAISEILELFLRVELMLKLSENKMEKERKKLEKAMKEFLNRLPDDPLMDLWKTRGFYKFDVIMNIWGLCEHCCDLRSVSVYILPMTLKLKNSILIGVIAHEFAHSFTGPKQLFTDDDVFDETDDNVFDELEYIDECQEQNEEMTDELVCEWGFATEMKEARKCIKKTSATSLIQF